MGRHKMHCKSGYGESESDDYMVNIVVTKNARQKWKWLQWKWKWWWRIGTHKMKGKSESVSDEWILGKHKIQGKSESDGEK